MEDIEYLEEYRDLVLPALNSAAAAAAASSETNKNLQSQKINDDGDDSSSSLDQDIFNCLFDDNSDDDEDYNNYQNSDSESALKPKTGSHENFELLDDNIVEIGEKVIQKVEISRQDQTNKFNIIAKTVNKISSSTVKPKSLMTKTSGTTVPLKTTKPQSTFETKAKSVATVRPTIQNQKQQYNLHKKSNLLQKQVSSSTLSFIQHQSPSTSAASTSSRPVQLPVLTRKHLATPLSTSPLNNKKTVATFLSTVGSPTVLKKVVKRPATIVKPEKIVIKDPANDPLELDDLSEAGSHNYSFTDISGETYNSVSDFEDEDSNDEYYSGNDDYYAYEDGEDGISSSSQVIELSNDSSGAPLNLEDLRATTPSPVISDESDISNNSSGFKITKTKSSKPYSNPDIIEGVLRKSEKPILLELLRAHNLLEDSVQNDEVDNIVIDITTSRENLVESLETQQIASLKKSLPLSATTTTATTTTVDSVNLNLTENDKSQTFSSINKNPTKHSKRTNKNKSKKKSGANMDDYRNLKSPGAASTDSDLSAVEELLEESYAEAMKRVKDVPFSNEEVGAEMEIGGEEEVIASEENKQKLPKAGVVIDYDDIHKDHAEIDMIEEKKTENIEQSDTDQKDIAAIEVDQKNLDIKEPKELLKSETKVNVEFKDKKINQLSEHLECSLEQKVIVQENPSCKNENITDDSLNATNSEGQETIKLVGSAKYDDDISTCDSRKKKRFRNLLTPEPTERSSEAAKSIDDIKDFKGFEEVQPVKKDEKIEAKNKSTQSLKTSGKDRPPESFKSPSTSHQPLKEKAKEIKDTNSRDNSKESRDKSSKSSKSKSSRDRSKDRSSGENSRDKSSRESSKDRSRESSKDRSKHSHDKEANTKHHHKDHRKSSDSSKESSRSRESRESKETKHVKLDSQESQKSTTVKKHHSSEGNKEKSSENKEKPPKEVDKHAKHLAKSNAESNNSKESKEHKSSSEKKDNKPTETIQKPSEKDSGKSLATPAKELKDSHKSFSSSTTYNQSSSHDSSKGSINVSKSTDLTKNNSETKKSQHSNKISTDSNKLITKKPSTSTSADNLKYSKTHVKPIDVLNCLNDSKKADNILQSSSEEPKSTTLAKSSNDGDLSLKAISVKKTIQNPVISIDSKTAKPNLNTSKSSCKSKESDKKDQQKIIKEPSFDSKKTSVKREDQDLAKKVPADLNKSLNEKKATSKVSTKSDGSNKTKKETPVKEISKETASIGSNSKSTEESGTKPCNLETKDTTAAKPILENVQKDKTISLPDDMKLKETPSDVKKTTETSKNTTGSIEKKIIEIKNKETEKVSMSPKKPPKPKEENIKKPATSKTNINQATKANKKEDSNTQMSEKRNTTEQKTDELEKNKEEDSQETTSSSEKLQNNSEKKPIVKYKNDIDEANKKETLNLKTKQTDLSEPRVNTDNQQTKKSKLKETNLKAVEGKASDKISEKMDASNNAVIQLKTEKSKVLQTFDSEQKEKEQEKNSKEKNESGNPSDLTTTKGKTQIIENKDKFKESKIAEKPVVSTTKCVSSPKVIKKTQKEVATDPMDKTTPIKSVKTIKHIKKPQYTKEVKIKDVTRGQEDKIDIMKTNDTDKPQISRAEQIINCESNEESKLDPSLAPTKPQHIEIKDSTTVSKIETEKSKRNLGEEIKQNEIIVKQPSQPMETKQCGEKILKTPEKPVPQEPGKIKTNIMGHILTKSVVILIEPLKLIQPVKINVEDNIEIEPRRTRSRTDITKFNDSIAKEEKISENTETRKAKRYSDSNVSERIDNNKPNETETEEQNVVELMKTRKRSDLKTELMKSEINANNETPNVLGEESTTSKDEIPTDDDRNKEDEEDIFEPIQTRRRGDVKSVTEKAKSKISHNDISKVGSIEKTSRRVEGKVFAEKVAEEGNSRPVKTRRRGVLEKETESENEATFQEGSCDEKSSIKSEKKEDHNESIKTKKPIDSKGKYDKEITEMHVEILDEKSLAKIETEKIKIEPIKNKRSGDSKEEERAQKETPQIESSDKKALIQKVAKERLESTKTRGSGDLKEHAGKEKCETQVESSDEKTSIEEESKEHFEPINNKMQVDLKDVEKEIPKPSEIEPSNEKTSIPKESEEHFEPVKTRREGDIKTEAEKEKSGAHQDKSNNEKNSARRKTEDNFEPIKNRRHEDRKGEAVKEKKEESQTESSDEKRSTQREADEHNFKPIKTKRREDHKDTEKEKTETSQVVPSYEKSPKQKEPQEHCEPIQTRRRGDLKEEADKGKKETLLLESPGRTFSEQKKMEEHFEPINIRGRGELKEDTGKEKNEKSSDQKEVEEHIEPIKTRRRGELKEAAGNEKSETSQVEPSDLTEKEAEGHFEAIKSKIRGDLKTDTEKEKTDKCQDKSNSEKSSSQREKEDLKEKKDVSLVEISDEKSFVQNKSEELNFEPIRTRRRADLKCEAKKDTTETSQIETIDEKCSEQKDKLFESTETKDIKDEASKDKNDASNVDSSKEKTSVVQTNKQHFETRKTRSRGDIKAETGKGVEMSQKNHSQSSEKKNVESDILKNTAEDNVELKNINHEDAKADSEREIFQDNSQNIQTTKREEDLMQVVALSTGKEESKTSQAEEIISTADKKHAEEINSKVLSDDVEQSENSKVAPKQFQPPNNSPFRTNSEIKKPSQENFNLESEMSGSESSITSSNSDNTLRRTLRKRGAESPFPENDSNKRVFKEPPIKSATQFTPKGVKIEKATNALISSSKRPLRSPADAENPNSTKKPRLDTSMKSTRSRSLHDDCLEEEELPIVAEELCEELHYLEEQPPELNAQKLNEPAAVILKITKNKNSKEGNEISTDKKVEEGGKDDKRTKTSIYVLQKEPFDNEEPKQCTNKDGLNINTKYNVNVKKRLRLEETKSKQDKHENVTKVPETPIQIKTNKAKANTTPNKSPVSTAVMSFSDWLKTKNQNTKAESKDAFISATTKESTPDILKRQGRVRVRLTPKILDSKSTEDKEKTAEVTKVPQEEERIICQSKQNRPALERKQENKTSPAKDDETTLESMDISEQLDKSLPQQSENQSQNTLQQQKTKGSNKKANVKRLQKKSSKIESSLTKSNTPTSITSPRMKKTEIDVLIESMSKEMKDGGINDLLKSETHVKRQRLASKRNAEQSKSYTFPVLTTATAKETIPNVRSSGLMQNKQIPKVLDLAENLEIAKTIPSSKEVSRSPTKRKPQQNSVESGRTSSKLIRSDILNTPDIDQPIMQENPKVLAAKSRKFVNNKELARQMKKDIQDFRSTSLVKSRKSLPVMSKEPLAKDVNISSRKSLTMSKQLPPPGEQIEVSERNLLQIPKQAGPSTLLNQIPRAENINKLYTDDKKRIDSHIKINQTESLLKAFKCRKLRVHLDRSVVEKYLNSITNQEKLVSTRIQKSLKEKVSAVPESPTDDTSVIIQNNSQTSLRIQSVVDASTVLSTASSNIMTKTPQDTLVRSDEITSGPTLQDSNSASISLSAVQQQPYNLSSRGDISAPLPIINVADANGTIELKNEFMDENPIELINDALLPDTPTLLARAQSITEAAQHALSSSVTPTDIRLITANNLENNFVPSFGVTPTALDNRGTCMYTFLHPAKYNRNHSNVLLDYCCPNLDGPMPAIDPTRIHAQVQVPVIELPASIVLTTKVVTRADLESENSSIPAIIRKKAEKIRKNMATHHKLAVATTAASTPPAPIVPTITHPHLAPIPRHTLPATINALTKQLPATTTITAKIRPPLPPQQSQMLVNQPSLQSPSSNLAPPVTSTLPKNTTVSVITKGHLSHLNSAQHSSLRSNLRRFDVLLKQLIQPYESLSFVDRHRIIEAVITSGKILPNDLEQTLVLMEEYIKQTLLLKNSSFNQPPAPATSAILSTNNYVASQSPVAAPLPTAKMPQLQPSPKILASTSPLATVNPYSRQLEQVQNKALTKVHSGSKNPSLTSTTIGGASGVGVAIKQKQVPIYDTDRNIIGYQMRMMTPMTTMPAFTKSTMSTHTGAIMSTCLDSGSDKVTEYSLNKRPVKRPAQDSPRVFYTTPPLKTSTPRAVTNPRVYPTQHSKNANVSTISQKTQGSTVTTVRSGGSVSSASSETITTTTTATVKRVTRSTATGSKIIIVSKSNQSSEETILPDANSSQQQAEQTEIKNEKDVD